MRRVNLIMACVFFVMSVGAGVFGRDLVESVAWLGCSVACGAHARIDDRDEKDGQK